MNLKLAFVQTKNFCIGQNQYSIFLDLNAKVVKIIYMMKYTLEINYNEISFSKNKIYH